MNCPGFEEFDALSPEDMNIVVHPDDGSGPRVTDTPDRVVDVLKGRMAALGFDAATVAARAGVGRKVVDGMLDRRPVRFADAIGVLHSVGVDPVGLPVEYMGVEWTDTGVPLHPGERIA